MSTLSKHQEIGSYTVAFPLKDSTYAETYRVKDNSGKNFFLKLFNYAKLDRTQFDDNGNVVELIISKQLNHNNLTHYHDSGEIIIDGKKMAYIVYDFISGETLAQKMAREKRCSVYDAKQYVLGVLEGLKYIHNQQIPIIHNEVTIENIMLDMTNNSPKIIDFGHARFLTQSNKSFQTVGLNPFYMAPETFNGIFTQQSDLYSVGAMLYHLIFGLPPYFVCIPSSRTDKEIVYEIISQERQKPLAINNKDLLDVDEQLVKIMQKALSNDVDFRFKNANDFILAINGEMVVDSISTTNKTLNQQHVKENKRGNGFNDIVGMDKLKQQLKRDVIDALNEPEKYKKYGITIPNGMLLYGPPGCGKTFFAKKFAEEVGFNFLIKTPADIKSRYVNATQENIKQMFEEAYKNAPTIIFIDEINELLPNRNGDIHEMAESAVNEMLAQMDRIGEKGVFIVGATNYPQKIDPAMLRHGRFDKKVFIGPPDVDTRSKMFEMFLKNRYVDFGIQYDKLAEMTNDYVSSDIKFIVDEAARTALGLNEKINMEILENTISNTVPSVSLDELKKYDNIKTEIEYINKSNNNNNTPKPRIGFKQNNDNGNK